MDTLVRWQGQCMGCNGTFDSGAQFDVCEICAGPCTDM